MLTASTESRRHPVSRSLLASLERRMDGPQRHRLLHGFPMAPMMVPDLHGAPEVPPGDRPLLVGVLPHPFCNPTVDGCGFCTFPHERYRRSRTLPLAEAIAHEIRWRTATMEDRPVEAVYIGGGTANLLPPEAFAVIADALEVFDLSRAELTLEGAPGYFGIHDAALLTRCAALGPRRLRISMGVQTFDEEWLGRMGRLGFGAPHHVEEAVGIARQLGAGTSCDLLVNLPGQPVEAMLADIGRAVSLGFDQICVYPLVLRGDLPVPWARDPAMLAALPHPAEGFESWRTVQEALRNAGYLRSTLTNHERADLAPGERFAYEPWSFRPDTCDGIGFGPGAISTFGLGSGQAVKWLSEGRSEAWLARMEPHPHPVARSFFYDPREDRLAVLTRRLCLLGWDNVPEETRRELRAELNVLEVAGLVTADGAAVRLTERGTFYADSVAGLLAERTVARRRARAGADDAVPHGMG